LRQFNEIADDGVRPDLTFLLDCPVALGLARTNQRGSVAGQPRQDRFEREKIEFHEKIRAGFLTMARAEPARFRVIDGAQAVEPVTRDIQKIVDEEVF
jgi:dTMP kinase